MPTGGGGTPNFVNTANRALGRISGPLLADNLLRNGVDLAFETQLLYVDVKNKRVGVKYGSPTVELFINNTTNTTYVNNVNENNIVTNVLNEKTLHNSITENFKSENKTTLNIEQNIINEINNY